MYRVYYLTVVEWELYARTDTEEEAWDRWDECCDKHPLSKVRMTKETVVKEA